MPLDLTDAELATAATACRAMAYREGRRAKELDNPTVRGPIEANSKPPWRRSSKRRASANPEAEAKSPAT
jgi:hypothetical protein